MEKQSYDLFKAVQSPSALKEEWPEDFDFVLNKIIALKKAIISDPPVNNHPRTFPISTEESWSHPGIIPGWRLVQPILANTMFPFWHNVKGSGTKLRAGDTALVLSHVHNVHTHRPELYKNHRLAGFRKELFQTCSNLFQDALKGYEPWDNALPAALPTQDLLGNSMQLEAERERLHSLMVQKHQEDYRQILATIRKPGVGNFPIHSTSLDSHEQEVWQSHTKQATPSILWATPEDVSDTLEQFCKVCRSLYRIFSCNSDLCLFNNRPLLGTSSSWRRRLFIHNPLWLLSP